MFNVKTKGTNLMNEYNMSELFGDILEEFQLESDLLFIGKGKREIVALCAPEEVDGKMKIGVTVENEYKGKKNNQILLKVIHIKFKEEDGKQVTDWGNSVVKGLIIPPGTMAAIDKAYSEAKSNPMEDEKFLGVQTCNLLSFTKQEANNRTTTTALITNKTVDIPDEVWQLQNEKYLHQLVESYNSMKQNTAKKNTESKDETNPWD